jgi:hypothetical protein
MKRGKPCTAGPAVRDIRPLDDARNALAVERVAAQSARAA